MSAHIIRRPCCNARISADRLFPGKVLFPHKPTCERAR